MSVEGGLKGAASERLAGTRLRVDEVPGEKKIIVLDVMIHLRGRRDCAAHERGRRRREAVGGDFDG